MNAEQRYGWCRVKFLANSGYFGQVATHRAKVKIVSEPDQETCRYYHPISDNLYAEIEYHVDTLIPSTVEVTHLLTLDDYMYWGDGVEVSKATLPLYVASGAVSADVKRWRQARKAPLLHHLKPL